MNSLREVLKIVSVLLALAPLCPAGTLTVDLGGGGDYTDIQSAIDVAATGDTVLVMPGEYVVTAPVTFKGKAIALRSEGGAAVTTIRMADAPVDPKRASVVVFESGETAEAVLDGFTITGGKGTMIQGPAPGNYGGGIACSNSSSPTISSCVIKGNCTVDVGGGIFCYESSPIIRDCTISENSASGGGVGISNSSPLLENCAVESNVGGAFINVGGTATLSRCRIVGNHGVAAISGPPGGLSILGPLNVVNCTISGNMYDAVFAPMGGEKKFTNCLVYGNGYGLTLYYSTSVMNCTIAMNKDKTLAPKSVFTNCIFWPKQANTLGTVKSCLTEKDPLFVKAGVYDFTRFKTMTICGQEVQMPDFIVEEPDFHLQAGSPAIDAGTSDGAPAEDIEGNPRPIGNGFDIGAYEAGEQVPCDTHCQGLVVNGPEGNLPGTYIATATASDESGDPVVFTFTAKRGAEAPLVVGPQAEASASFVLGAGTWTVEVSAGDGSPCVAASDAKCSSTVVVEACPSAGDTHCLGLQVSGPEGNLPGTYTATATAKDDSGDPVIYTFTAKRGGEAPVVVGPQAGASANFDLGAGAWTLSVDIDDDPDCSDAAADARCSTTVTVVPPGGLVIPGDANGDSRFDISDAVAALGVLFLGNPARFPCGDGSPLDPANVSLMDWQPDGAVDISDAVAILNFLFLGGKPHTLAPEADGRGCVRIAGCSDICGQ